MKLNPNCIRDILLSVEETVSFTNEFEYSDDVETCERLKDYDENEIMYHFRQCDLAGFFYKYIFDSMGYITIKDLTPAGHAFLANIRSDTIWNKTKSIAGDLGVSSIHALKDIAVQVVAEVIKSSLGLSGTS